MRGDDGGGRVVLGHAVAADVAAVVALVESAYRGPSSRAGWTTEADLLDDQRTSEAQVAALVEPVGSGSVVLLARGEAPDGELLGCCHVCDRGGGTAYFGMFAVRPRKQGAGVGGTLLAAAERQARDAWDAERMELTVIDVRRELIDFYVRRGYRPTGELRQFPFAAHLRFAVLVKPLP